MSQKPSSFLQEIVGKDVTVQLNSQIEYKGKMACLDGFMNIALENTTEYALEKKTAEYGDCFIRGNNGIPLTNPQFCLLLWSSVLYKAYRYSISIK
jgi:U6 snRNA-associated Sm-like protein LSm6